MAYHYYDEKGNHRGEILTEEEHQRRSCLGILGIIILVIGAVIVEYWYIFLGIAVVGLIIWLIIKNSHTKETRKSTAKHSSQFQERHKQIGTYHNITESSLDRNNVKVTVTVVDEDVDKTETSEVSCDNKVSEPTKSYSKSKVPFMILGGVLSVILLVGGAVLIYKKGQASMIASTSSVTSSQDHIVENPETEVIEVPANEQSASEIVYANAYDGFVNMREIPTSKGAIIEKFKNGSKGAILLEEDEEWAKIDYQGTIGYVYKKYLTYTPTKEVTVNIDGNWLRGVWKESNKNYAYLIFNNGTYAIQSLSETLAYGTYMLEGEEIVFSTKVNKTDLTPDIERYRVNTSIKCVGNMSKHELIEDYQRYDYSDRLIWTKSQYAALRKEILNLIQNGQ